MAAHHLVRWADPVKNRWDLLLDEAIAVILERRIDEWDPPADVVKAFPGTPQQCKLYLLACGFERWVTSLGP